MTIEQFLELRMRQMLEAFSDTVLTRHAMHDDGDDFPTPYVGFGNDTLERQARLKAGNRIICPRCGQTHVVVGGKTQDDEDSDLVLSYNCGSQTMLAGVAGRNVLGLVVDVKGKID